MRVYHFIKYNHQTTIKHLHHHHFHDHVVLCFDFEDGIQDIKDHSNTISLKDKHRQYFKSIVKKTNTNLKIGVRLNTSDNEELKKDILTIRGLNLHAIFLPKIGHRIQLLKLMSLLAENDIIYKEIIPVIENKNGLNNIDEILEIDNINNIAFGHCDYNLSLNIFPFFHQENFEYWRWVNRLINKANKNKVNFINSPYLSNNHMAFFSSMLHHLDRLTYGHFGQICLSNRQTKICLNNTIDPPNFDKLLHNRKRLYPMASEVEGIIHDFEKYNTGKGLSKTKNRIISYQEYICAKKHAPFIEQKKINLAFVGGCFPVQHNILFEDIFLTKMMEQVNNGCQLKVQIDIIRYERLSSVLEKIKKLNSNHQLDYLIFSIRPEPYLRLIKFYYKYLDHQGKLRHSLNIPWLNIINPEKYDILTLGRKYDLKTAIRTSKATKYLVDKNYFLGKLVGNQANALKKFTELIAEIEAYALLHKIRLILLGPPLRANSPYEPTLCMDLDHHIKNNYAHLTYINGLMDYFEGQTLFQENRIHVNELYHHLQAENLSKEIIELQTQ